MKHDKVTCEHTGEGVMHKVVQIWPGLICM